VRRGEVWWARLSAPRRSRPVVLLSREEAYPIRSHVTVAPVTRSARNIAVEVPVGPADGIRQESVINLDDILTIPMTMLDRRITRLSKERMRDVADAIKFALDLP